MKAPLFSVRVNGEKQPAVRNPFFSCCNRGRGGEEEEVGEDQCLQLWERVVQTKRKNSPDQ